MKFRLQELASAAMLGSVPLALGCGEASAHASERGHVMLLPTGYYLAGGALAVTVSFLILAIVPPDPLNRLAHRRIRLLDCRDGRGALVAGTLSFLVTAGLVAAGLFGSRDPLSNPLPLVVWTLLWVALTLAHGLFGNLWSAINPWLAPYRLAALVLGRKHPGTAPVRLADAIGYWPAMLQFAAFAWFELVYPAPDDPGRLALAVSVYWAANFVAMLVVGYHDWMRRGECFSVFFNIIAKLAIFERARRPEDPRLRAVSLCLPGARLVDARPLPLTGVAFLLLALGSVSFDGLMRTFLWLDANGINPLEFPGRSAAIRANSIGLALTWSILMLAFLAAVLVGERLARSPHAFEAAAGKLVWSVIPISLAYHFAHYLTALLVNTQYALISLSDPLALGWNLFGTADRQVSAGIILGHDAARIIWNAQAATIIGGHVLAVTVAHVIAYRLHGAHREAALSQVPLAVLMVLYTVFGLWLLSAPTAA